MVGVFAPFDKAYSPGGVNFDENLRKKVKIPFSSDLCRTPRLPLENIDLFWGTSRRREDKNNKAWYIFSHTVFQTSIFYILRWLTIEVLSISIPVGQIIIHSVTITGLQTVSGRNIVWKNIYQPFLFGVDSESFFDLTFFLLLNRFSSFRNQPKQGIIAGCNWDTEEQIKGKCSGIVKDIEEVLTKPFWVVKKLNRLECINCVSMHLFTESSLHL